MPMIDPKGVPATALVKGYISSMTAKQLRTFVVWQENGKVFTAANRPDAEAMGRAALSIQDGAVEVAAAALHAWRFKPEGAETPEHGLCTIVLCAAHELHVGKPVPWDELPPEIKEVHRLTAQAVVSAAVAHNVPKTEPSRIVKPT